MTAFPSYGIGTVSVTAGGTVVTGTGTIWTGVNARPGDEIIIGNNPAVMVMDVTDSTHLVVNAWPFTTASGATYKILFNSPLRFVGGQAMADVDTLIQMLTNGNFPTISGGAAASSVLALQSTSGVGTSDRISMRTGSQIERMGFESDGSIVVGKAGYATPPDAYFKVMSISNSPWTVSIEQYTADNSPAILLMAKSRNAVAGVHTLVQDNDLCAAITMRGSNGSVYHTLGYMDAFVDGVASASSMPGRLTFGVGLIGTLTRPERFRITTRGNVIVGGADVGAAALPTTATDAFLYVPTCAGTPTGVPTSYTGRAPIVINSTNNKLYFYSGGAWRDAGP